MVLQRAEGRVFFHRGATALSAHLRHGWRRLLSRPVRPYPAFVVHFPDLLFVCLRYCLILTPEMLLVPMQIEFCFKAKIFPCSILSEVSLCNTLSLLPFFFAFSTCLPCNTRRCRSDPGMQAPCLPGRLESVVFFYVSDPGFFLYFLSLFVKKILLVFFGAKFSSFFLDSSFWFLVSPQRFSVSKLHCMTAYSTTMHMKSHSRLVLFPFGSDMMGFAPVLVFYSAWLLTQRKWDECILGVDA